MLMKIGSQLPTASTFRTTTVKANLNLQENKTLKHLLPAQKAFHTLPWEMIVNQMTLDYDLLSFDLTFKNNLPFSQCSPVKPEGHRHRYFFSVNPD